jgi:hypothetical protein
MKNLWKASLLGVAALGVANIASAQVTASQSGPVSVSNASSGNLQQFIVSLDAAGDDATGPKITAFDIQLNTGGANVWHVQTFDDSLTPPGGAPSPFVDSQPTGTRRNADTHLLLSGNDADNTALVGRLIALGIVCGTIATINSIANHHSKGDTQ